MTLPTVSVILPTFNRVAYIAESIQSILTQTVAAKELVVVDDGSTDDTAGVVAQFGDRVTYVRQDNAGKLTAIATGLDRVSGDLVWIMDDDDLAAPDALQNLAEPFARDASLVLSYGRMTRFDDANPEAADQLVDYPDDPRPFLVQMMEDCFVTGHPCVLVKRAALQDIRPFDRAVIASVDYYLHLEVAKRGPAAAVEHVVLRQRQHGGLRGPAHSRYGEADRNAKWVAHDAYLLTKLFKELPLGAYLAGPPFDDRQLNDLERRQALIQKAVIAGRKKLWPEALAALAEAMNVRPSQALSRSELRILEGMLGSRYGIAEIYTAPDLLDAVRDACKTRPDRTRILTAVSRPLLHEVKIAARDVDARRAAQAVRSFARLMDRRAAQVALRSIFARQMRRVAMRLNFQQDRNL